MSIKANWTFKDGKESVSGDAYEKLHGERNIEKFGNETMQNFIDRSLPNQATSLKYKFFYLKGNELKQFLSAINWDSEFKDHWEKAQNPTEPDLAITRKESAKKMQEPKLIFCLLEESGTEGLSGDEYAEGNYRRLIRDAFRTSGDGTTGGGHGYGKIVYFIHSVIRTAFFFSYVSGTSLNLFVGKSLITNRLLDGDLFDGGASFGEKSGNFAYKRLEGQEAKYYANSLGISRKRLGTGTSILIPGFEADENNETPEKIARKLKNEIEKNYWPFLIANNKSKISIVFEDNRGNLETIKPDPLSSDYKFFCEALNVPDIGCVKKIDKKNQTARKIFNDISFPTRVDASKDPQAQYNPDIRLTITSRSNSQMGKEPNTIALIRGHGKVVKYEPVSRSINDHTPLYGVLQVGEAANNNKEGQWSEEYWRSLEPTGHDNWVVQEAAKKKWTNPYTNPKNELFSKIRGEWLSDLIDSSIPTGESVSPNLTRLFNFGGGKEGGKSISLSNEKVTFDPVNRIWKLEGTFEISSVNADPWEVEISVRPVTDDGTTNKSLDLDIINVSDPQHINASLIDANKKAVFSIQQTPGQPILNIFQYNLEAFDLKGLPRTYLIETKSSRH